MYDPSMVLSRSCVDSCSEYYVMKPIQHLVETAIYVDDLAAAERFYRDILGLPLLGKEAGRHVFFQAGQSQVLLIFRPEATLKGDRLPPHGGRGPGHVAFGISREDLDRWRDRLESDRRPN